MKAPINLQQESFIKEIMESGFHKAAKAFSAMAKTEVSIESLMLKYLEHPDQVNSILPNSNSLVVLTTDMIGELKGKSYLVFSEEESHKIALACSPIPLLSGQTEFEDAILLEIDNILSASVITQVSNKLNLKIYGDIPSLKKSNYNDVLAILKKDFSHYQTNSQELMLVSSTHFSFKNEVHLRPQFIWKFNHSFLEAIKENVAWSGTVL